MVKRVNFLDKHGKVKTKAFFKSKEKDKKYVGFIVDFNPKTLELKVHKVYKIKKVK